MKERRHCDTVDEKIRNLKIQYERPDGNKIDYQVIKIMPAASELKMKSKSGEEYTIEKYFKNKYKYQLRFPNYPCIHVGRKDNMVYLPIELCKIKKQSKVLPMASLTDEQSRTMIMKATMLPKDRRSFITSKLKQLSSNYDRDSYANTFGLKVSGKMVEVEGRVLNPPALKYKNAESKDMAFTEVFDGQWSSGTMSDGKALKLVKPMELKYWGVLDLAKVPNKVKEKFVDRLYEEGKIRGILVEYPTYCEANAKYLSQVKQTFKKLHDHIQKDGGSTQLIMVITAKKGPPRGELKYLGDAILKIPTQFVMKNTVFAVENRRRRDQVLHNLCLKINHKLGGVNHALWKRPAIMNRLVMVVGADVTHPAPGDVSRKPSIAAVVGSTDANVSQFNVEIRLQDKGRVVEQIEQMEKIMSSLLLRFSQQNQQKKPEQIIYYRDGVSEGQFQAVLNHELFAIRKACSELEVGYEPKVTFIIAQKRHKTRFFVENPNEGIGKTNNIPAGTVVDTKITTLSETDFFLASHYGIQVAIL